MFQIFSKRVAKSGSCTNKEQDVYGHRPLHVQYILCLWPVFQCPVCKCVYSSLAIIFIFLFFCLLICLSLVM